MDFFDIFFIINAIFVVASGLGVLFARKVMQSALSLIFALVAVANVFLLANSEYLWVIQISVYGGGIAVLLLFAGRLTSNEEDHFYFDRGDFLLSFLFTGMVLANLFIVIFNGLPTPSGNIATTDDGQTLLTQFFNNLWQTDVGLGIVLPFIALLFLAALLASVKLAIKEEAE